MADATNEIIPAEFMSKDMLESFPTTPDEIRAYIESIGLTTEETIFRASEYDLADKNDLIKTPLFIIQWREKMSEDYGSIYVIVHAVNTETGEKVVFVDGGTGIAAQLIEVTAKRADAGVSGPALRSALLIPKGLVRSDYDAHKNAAGDVIPAGTTYYLG